MTSTGFETKAISTAATSMLRQPDPAGAAPGAARGPLPHDTDLARVVEAWPHLPPAVRGRIVELAEGGV
jgi:hypothetical protein